ncbi:MAG: hypothetical protein ABEI74_00625 [Candidatus Pacearchaeota archaeon]
MDKEGPTRNEVLDNLVKHVPQDASYYNALIRDSLDENFDQLFGNIETIVDKYISMKNFPRKIWDTREPIKQIKAAYENVEQFFTEDVSRLVKKHFSSSDIYQDNLLNNNHYSVIPKMNSFSEESAKRYLISLDINPKYKTSSLYSLIFGDGTGMSDKDLPYSDNNLKLF